MRIDLTDLRLFLLVVEHGSLTQGAVAMNLSLAAVSERISNMESILGTPLFERVRRGVRTTVAGDALIRHARLILGQVEQMRGELDTYASGLKGRVRLMSNTAALSSFLPQKLCDFLARYPDLSVDVDEKPSTDIVLAVAKGHADLGIVANIIDLAALQAEVIAQDQLVVVVKRTHRIASLPFVTLAEIVDEKFIGLSDAALERHLGERASLLGRKIDYRIRMRSIENVCMMLEAEIGIAVLSASAIESLQRPDLVIVPIQEPWATRQLYVCARDFAALPPRTQLLASFLMGTLDSIEMGKMH